MTRYWRFARAQWDRVLGWVLVAGGALLLVTGAANVSRAADQLDQLSYLASGPAVGLFLLGVGAVLLLTADLRDEWTKLDEISALLRSAAGGPSDDAPGDEISVTDRSLGSAGPAGRQGDPLAVRAGAVVLAVAGLGILGGATGVRQSLERASAVRWTGLSGVSLALVALVAAALYLRARRDITRQMAVVDSAVAPLLSGPGRAVAVRDRSGDGYVVSGSKRWHRAGCDLLAFSEATPISAAGVADAGLEPCPLCR